MEKPTMPVGTASFPAHIAITDVKRFVKLNSDGEVILCTAGAKAVGVVQLPVDADEMATVMGWGIAVVEAGGAIAVNAKVTSDSTGRAVTCPLATLTSTELTDTVCTIDSGTSTTLTVPPGTTVIPTQGVNGTALDAASTAGDFIRVML